MSEYLRLYQPGGSYFFTVVTHQRVQILSQPGNIFRLHSAFHKVIKKHPFTLEAFVILPDHIHCIWQMPARDSNYSTRWRLIKSYFSGGFNHMMNKRGEKGIWQRKNLNSLVSNDGKEIRTSWLIQTAIFAHVFWGWWIRFA